MTLTIDDDNIDVGRTTVGFQWKREWNAPQVPSSYQITRCVPPAAMERVAMIPGRKFIDPNCQPSTTYQYTVTTVGIAPPESDSVQVTTRPPTEFPDSVTFFHDYLSKLFARDQYGQGLRWCARWQEHMECVVVVNELWRAYEAHRPPDDPTTPSTERAVWLTVYAYPLMAHLWSADGGLKDCSHNPDQREHTDPGYPPLAG
jgi:hypothetical protein